MSLNFCAGFAPVRKPTIPIFSDGGINPNSEPKKPPIFSDGGINPNPDPYSKHPLPHVCYLA